MKKATIAAFILLAFSSCKKKENEKTFCIIFNAQKSYVLNTNSLPDSSAIYFKVTDRIATDRKYLMQEFTRTVTSKEADLITDSIIMKSPYGDDGKRVRYSIDSSTGVPTYFYSSGALVAQKLCN